MKGSSKNLFIALIVLTGLVLLSSCATGPVAKTGLYENKEYRFTVEYPENFLPEPENQLKKFVVFSAREGSGFPIVSVVISDKKIEFKDVPVYIVKRLETVIGLSNTKILSKKHTKLTDGTPAYELIVTGMPFGGMVLSHMFLFVNKSNKTIHVGVITSEELSEDLKKIPYSLKFYK